MKRDFALPENDIDFLDKSGLCWETVTDTRFNWLIIHDFPVPSGYNCNKVNVALRIDRGYPVSQIDMAYFDPPLRLLNGRVIPASNANQSIQGKVWQRWSRHRTGQNPWRPGIDDVSTHLQAVSSWFERELKRQM